MTVDRERAARACAAPCGRACFGLQRDLRRAVGPERRLRPGEHRGRQLRACAPAARRSPARRSPGARGAGHRDRRALAAQRRALAASRSGASPSAPPVAGAARSRAISARAASSRPCSAAFAPSASVTAVVSDAIWARSGAVSCSMSAGRERGERRLRRVGRRRRCRQVASHAAAGRPPSRGRRRCGPSRPGSTSPGRPRGRPTRLLERHVVVERVGVLPGEDRRLGRRAPRRRGTSRAAARRVALGQQPSVLRGRSRAGCGTRRGQPRS